ncbi:MAG: hypothetical protein ACRDK0_05305, partial [Solirubrobacteraceae bacterium]
MDQSARICPFCGALPGDGLFCAACGRNLSAVERLPTRAEWQRAPPPASGAAAAASDSLAERCAGATAAFLEA